MKFCLFQMHTGSSGQPIHSCLFLANHLTILGMKPFAPQLRGDTSLGGRLAWLTFCLLTEYSCSERHDLSMPI